MGSGGQTGSVVVGIHENIIFKKMITFYSLKNRTIPGRKTHGLSMKLENLPFKTACLKTQHGF